MIRLIAGGMLFVWLAAVMACSAECLGKNCNCDSFKSGQAATSNGQSHDSDNDDDSFCISLHSLTPVSASTSFIAPDFKLVLTFDFLSSTQMLDIEPFEKLILRQPPDREFVFTPEVSLGAAFRSLAPPVLV